MDFLTYKTLLNHLRMGKRLSAALYVHYSALNHLPMELIDFLNQVLVQSGLTHFRYTIVKFFTRDFKLSLLYYPDFFEHPYPALHLSCTIDLLTYKYRTKDYRKSVNPPILHRKETFLSPHHPAVPKFHVLTEEAKRAGLFEKVHHIGFKQDWEKLIHQKGYQYQEGHLIPLPQSLQESPPVYRHRTAINRHRLSTPIQSLLHHGYLNGKYSVFDYGCGRGHDVYELQTYGLDVQGWDPVYAPHQLKCSADIVNLGFVINVIENPEERQITLQEAYYLCRYFLVVAVMLKKGNLDQKFQSYGDGVITRRNTFQKYYAQQEIKMYLENTLKHQAIAIGPGLFYVFHNVREEQLFLSRRQRVKRPSWQQKIHQTGLEDFWAHCLELGRLPTSEEFECSDQIRTFFDSLPQAFSFLLKHYGKEAFQQAQQARTEDLLVYLALDLFGQKTKRRYSHCPQSLKNDIRAFFGNYTTARNLATKLLFSAGCPEVIEEACVNFSKTMGYLHHHQFQLHTRYIHQLPAILRIYLGCATQLYGDIEQADLVKIHIHSGKVSLMVYDDFIHKPLPELKQRIKIKLREQQIDFFDYIGEYLSPFLYLKSYYLGKDFPFYEEQRKFDESLRKLELFDLSGYGPSKEVFYTLLEQHGYEIRGFELLKP